MTSTASTPVTTPAPDPGELRLVSVLVSGLPRELGTIDEPARYTVPAVFSRQVTPQERARIEDPATARRLAELAGPGLELSVSDRRLLIKNTTLAQLQGGLAAALAAMLREIDRELGAERARRSAEADAMYVEEHDREAAVTAAAAAIRFE
jgi:hypothetical protein